MIPESKETIGQPPTQWSANGDGGGCIRREGDAQVMVDLKGPGVLWRTWSARAGGGHIKIFIDGNAAPVIDKPFDAYFGDYEKEFPGLAMTLSRGRNEFVPISLGDGLLRQVASWRPAGVHAACAGLR